MPTDSTTHRWVPNAAIAALVDGSTGVVDPQGDILPSAVGYTPAELNANFATLTAKVNAILAALRVSGEIAS